ncbi:Nuclear transport factor 2 [Pseudocyphellaria aurata]|nr:Nuclear transport factor 2 [Pseudocyphellaria aurata]
MAGKQAYQDSSSLKLLAHSDTSLRFQQRLRYFATVARKSYAPDIRRNQKPCQDRKIRVATPADDGTEQFTAFYYETFDKGLHEGGLRNLAALYREQSMLTFETAAVRGVSDIIEKLGSLPFKQVKHQLATLDAQPSNDSGGILVMVTGALLVDEEQRPMNYTQAFQLLPDGAGSYFIFNDVFKLIY